MVCCKNEFDMNGPPGTRPDSEGGTDPEAEKRTG